MLQIAILIVILDLITKTMVVYLLKPGNPIVLIPAFFGESVGPILQLNLIRNPGAAFSLGSNSTYLLSALAIIISLYIWRTSKRIINMWWTLSLGAILGGAIGNLLDRIFRAPSIFRGEVVDFLQIPYWAIFNVADMAVSISAVVIAIMTLLGKDPFEKKVS